jgi:hypothetical protein
MKNKEKRNKEWSAGTLRNEPVAGGAKEWSAASLRLEPKTEGNKEWSAAPVRNEPKTTGTKEWSTAPVRNEPKTEGAKEWSAAPVRMETVARDGPEGRDGDDSGPYVHYDSAEDVLIGSGYHSHPAVEHPPPGKPLYDFTIGKYLFSYLLEYLKVEFPWPVGPLRDCQAIVVVYTAFSSLLILLLIRCFPRLCHGEFCSHS